MRTETELQRAHDRVVVAIMAAGNRGVDDAVIDRLQATLDVFCWALGHSDCFYSEGQRMPNHLDALLQLGPRVPRRRSLGVHALRPEHDAPQPASPGQREGR